MEAPFFTKASDGALSGRFGGFFLTYMPVEGSANVTVFVKEHWNLPDSDYREVFMEEVGYVSMAIPLPFISISPISSTVFPS